MSRTRPSSLSRTNSALRNSSAIAVIRSFAALNSSSRSIVTSLSAAEHPMPPGPPLCALLSPSRSGVGLLCPIGFLLDRLRRFSGFSEGIQLRLEGRRPLLGYLPAGSFGSEFLTNLSQFAHKW